MLLLLLLRGSPTSPAAWLCAVQSSCTLFWPWYAVRSAVAVHDMCVLLRSDTDSCLLSCCRYKHGLMLH
jgi:hypothetical protein